MRQSILVAAGVLVALVALGRVALAQNLTGDDRDERLIGSTQRDSISSWGGEAPIKGLRAIDSLNGGADNDYICAGPTDEQGIPSSQPAVTTSSNAATGATG